MTSCDSGSVGRSVAVIFRAPYLSRIGAHRLAPADCGRTAGIIRGPCSSTRSRSRSAPSASTGMGSCTRSPPSPRPGWRCGRPGGGARTRIWCGPGSWWSRSAGHRSRLYHVIHLWDFYSQNPGLILQVWNGGLGIPGRGGRRSARVWLLHAVQPPPVRALVRHLRLGDAARPGHRAARQLRQPGALRPADHAAVGDPIDAAHRVPEWANLDPLPGRHDRFLPLFAYEAILSLVSWGCLLWIGRRFAAASTTATCCIIFICYGLVRSYLETYRVAELDDRRRSLRPPGSGSACFILARS